jgi:uncharacterized membrane protein
MTYSARYISVTIERPFDEVYDYASNPENLPAWASGLSSNIRKDGGSWVAESPMGRVKIKFADNNPFGVLDHEVTLPSGAVVFNPMRVFPNADGSEVLFTLYHLPGMTKEQLAADAKAVQRDLQKLKRNLEGGPR